MFSLHELHSCYCLSLLQLEEIKTSLKVKGNTYRSMPRTLVDIDVYTVDEYQVRRGMLQPDWSVGQCLFSSI